MRVQADKFKLGWRLLGIAVLVIFISLSLARHGFYVDEIYSFAHSNSTVDAYIAQSLDAELSVDDFSKAICGHWIKGEVFKEWLEGDGKTDFLRPIKLLEKVMHPPFYFLLFHGVSSLGGFHFNQWVGLSLNIPALMLLCYFFYQLMGVCLKSKTAIFYAMMLFVFSPLVLDMEVYIRGYLWAMAWLLGGMWQSVKTVDEKELSFKSFFAMFICFVLLFLTHFYGVVFAFFLSVVISAVLLKQKRFKKLLVYDAVMLLSVALTVLIYPRIYDAFMNSSYGKNIIKPEMFLRLDFVLDLVMFAIKEMFVNLSGVHSDWVWGIVICCGIMFGINGGNLYGKIMLLAGGLSGIAVALIAPNHGIYNARYYFGTIMMLFVAVCVAFFGLTEKMKIKANVKCLSAVVLASLWVGRAFLYSPYLAQERDIWEIGDLIRGKKVVYLHQYIAGFYNFAPLFKETDEVYVLSAKDDIKSFFENENFQAQSVVIAEVGMGQKKYSSRASLREITDGKLQYVGMYQGDRLLYDVYKKIGEK